MKVYLWWIALVLTWGLGGCIRGVEDVDPRFVELSIRVQDPGATPVAGAEVQVAARNECEPVDFPFPGPRSVTDVSGTFRYLDSFHHGPEAFCFVIWLNPPASSGLAQQITTVPEVRLYPTARSVRPQEVIVTLERS